MWPTGEVNTRGLFPIFASYFKGMLKNWKENSQTDSNPGPTSTEGGSSASSAALPCSCSLQKGTAEIPSLLRMPQAEIRHVTVPYAQVRANPPLQHQAHRGASAASSAGAAGATAPDRVFSGRTRFQPELLTPEQRRLRAGRALAARTPSSPPGTRSGRSARTRPGTAAPSSPLSSGAGWW